MAKQLSLFDFGVTAEESCMMCHLSSECSGCCKTCIALGKNGTCNGQACSQNMKEYESARLSNWLWLVNEYKRLNDVAHRVLTKSQIKHYKIKQL